MISKLFNFIRSFINSIKNTYFNIFGRIYLYLCGANYFGKDTLFFGFPKILKASTGILFIGNYCTFRSKATSNLIGINRPCILSIHNNAKLVIGNNCGFSGTVIGCFSEIVIYDFVRCGANTLITDGDWHLNDYRSGPPRPIVIERNVWLGVNVIVLKGVRIGENTVIGAGSIVTKDIPANVIAAGNPCKIIRQLENKKN